jgi:lincosamide nucleotidyltransferase A/C/D/E
VLAHEVVAILDLIEAAAIPVWLDGGWGVDALLGTQTRRHDDLDLVVALDRVDDVLRAAAPLGFALVEDQRPTRAILRSPDARQIDLHPVTFDAGGTGWQAGAAPDGTDCPYPASGFGRGEVLGRAVPCLTADLQLAHHRGYEPRARDHHDIRALASAFDLDLPDPY